MKTKTGLNIIERKVGNVIRIDVYTNQELEDRTLLNRIQDFINRL